MIYRQSYKMYWWDVPICDNRNNADKRLETEILQVWSDESSLLLLHRTI